MSNYHKIQTVFKRDPATNYKTLLEGEYSLPEFEYLAMNKWVFTEKVDGTNIGICFKGGKITFHGHTDRAQIPGPLIERLSERFLPQVERFNEKFGDAEVGLYGEGYGPKIQKGGGNYRADQDFVLFDVAVDAWWLQRADVEDIACFFGLDLVPIVGKGTLLEMVEQVKAGVKSTWGDFQAEGYVARPAIELRTRANHRIITKIKSRDFAVGRGKIVGWLSVAGEYKPGDQPPSGYNDWQEWAKVQHKAGLRQERCSQCGKFKYTQEIASTTQETQIAYRTKRDAMNETNPVETVVNVVVCNDCHST